MAETLHKNALITGAAHRIGRAMALALAKDGWSVAVHYHRSHEAAVAVADEIVAAGGRAAIVQADLANESEVLTLVPASVEALGPLGLLVNNASRFEQDAALTATRASWDTHLETNLRAPFVLIQAFAARLPKDSLGVVVNMVDQRVWNSDTPFHVIYLEQSRTVGTDPNPGASTGAAHPGQRHRPRPHLTQPTADCGTIRPPMRRNAPEARPFA